MNTVKAQRTNDTDQEVIEMFSALTEENKKAILYFLLESLSEQAASSY